MCDVSVRVAVRIRPLVETEVEKGCRMCLDTVPDEPQIQVRGTDKAFTYNHVFRPEVDQDEFYNTTVKGMLTNIFQGYNVTIFAYGQTGSGKTHTMGTNYTGGDDMGVIPRAVNDIFEIMGRKEDHEFKVAVSFMELYQEQLYDLLSEKARSQCVVDIREDLKSIKVIGLTEKEVRNADETFACLAQGSLGRATGATAMNAQSSRSHAIFTILIQQQKKDDPHSATTAKFHLVDLAGSERSKKTQATGERFKEGININKGLLALGNVISQLGEGSNYVGYRDSKLTRLLQDSLGGNSVTLMIACVSPADYNLEETISTLRYADRARKIKNKPIINQDPRAAEINRLNKLIHDLRLAVLNQGSGMVGTVCPPEHAELLEKNRSLQKKIRDLTERLNADLIEFVHMHERAELAEHAREKIKTDMAVILRECEEVLKCFDTNPAETTEHRAKLKSIYDKIMDFQNDQKKSAEELLLHELSVKSQSSSTANIHLNDTDEKDDLDDLQVEDEPRDVSEVDLDEEHEEHTLRQAERNLEVQNINKELALKEELVSKLLANASHMVEYSKELEDMEREIKSLQSEKEDLLQMLRNAQMSNVSSKLAEARRKKVQELEKKIGELTRKCTEQSKVIKMKEKSDLRIKNLTSEIQSMKQIRVKLIRQMRDESEKFNRWKQSRERELCKLKDQDRKRQNQMARMESQNSKRQNVLKRKVEEACAINKRLKEALEMQRKAQLRREKPGSSKEDVRNWVAQELDVLLSTIDAESSLVRLMQDRALLTKKLDKLKSNVGKYDPRLYAKHMEQLTEDLELRSAQIVDLQQKIVESDQENKARTRWHVIQSMADAKAALKMLFEIAAESRQKQYKTSYEYDELMEKCDSMQLKLRQFELQGKEEKTRHRQEVARLNAEHEEHVAILFEQLRGGGKSCSEDEVEGDVHLRQELEIYKNLESGAETVMTEKGQSILTENDVRIKKDTFKLPLKSQRLHDVEYNLSFGLSDDSLTEDDVKKDPDWKKTPLYNRIRKILNTTRNSADERVTAKRSSEGNIKCACKTKCSTRLCSCRKNNMPCTNCDCNTEICQNRDTENIKRTLFPDQSNDEKSDDSFKKPRTRSSQAKIQRVMNATVVLHANSDADTEEIESD